MQTIKQAISEFGIIKKIYDMLDTRSLTALAATCHGELRLVARYLGAAEYELTFTPVAKYCELKRDRTCMTCGWFDPNIRGRSCGLCDYCAECNQPSRELVNCTTFGTRSFMQNGSKFVCGSCAITCVICGYIWGQINSQDDNFVCDFCQSGGDSDSDHDEYADDFTALDEADHRDNERDIEFYSQDEYNSYRVSTDIHSEWDE